MAANRAFVPESDPAGSRDHLPRTEIHRIGSALRALLAPRMGARVDTWRQSVLRSLRILTCSDKSVLVVRWATAPAACAEGMGRDVLTSYINHYAALDRSQVAVKEYGREVWSLDQLWPAGDLEKSRYYQAFAMPQGLHSTIGVTLQFTSPKALVSLVFHKTLPESQAATDHRRELLNLLLEPIRVGFGTDLGSADPSPHMSSLIEVAGQALALFGMDGRELTQNPVLRRILGQDPERDSLLEQIRAVARSVLVSVATRGDPAGPAHCQANGTRREVATSQAAYRLRGNLVGRNELGHPTAVLVSLDRVAFQVPAPDSLRARFGLTLRELQVVSLLMHRLSNAEIARMLGISPHTARHHTESVLAKFGVRSRASLRRAITEIPAG